MKSNEFKMLIIFTHLDLSSLLIITIRLDMVETVGNESKIAKIHQFPKLHDGHY